MIEIEELQVVETSRHSPSYLYCSKAMGGTRNLNRVKLNDRRQIWNG
jgi:hypothetical protein